MIKFVVGLVFHGFPPTMIFQGKTHPDWQADLLNGPGGRVKDGETEQQAMSREFKEETGLEIAPEDWDQVLVETARMRPDDALPGWIPYQVYYFRHTIIADIAPIIKKPEDSDEPVGWMGVRQVLSDRFAAVGVVGNLQWIIPLALDWRRNMTFTMVADDIRRKPKW